MTTEQLLYDIKGIKEGPTFLERAAELRAESVEISRLMDNSCTVQEADALYQRSLRLAQAVDRLLEEVQEVV